MNASGNGITRCAAANCTNNSRNSVISFFRFPKDNNRAQIWLKACNREDLMGKLIKIYNTSYRLCAMHFEDNMFLNDLHNRLHKKAVPRLFTTPEGSSPSQSGKPSTIFDTPIKDEDTSIPQQVPDVLIKQEHQSTVWTQTSQNLLLHSPRKEKYRRTIKELRNKNFRLKQIIQKLREGSSVGNSSNYLESISLDDYKKLTYKFCHSEELANFINIQVSESLKTPKGMSQTDLKAL